MYHTCSYRIDAYTCNNLIFVLDIRFVDLCTRIHSNLLYSLMPSSPHKVHHLINFRFFTHKCIFLINFLILFLQNKQISRNLVTGRGALNGKLADVLAAKYTIGNKLLPIYY